MDTATPATPSMNYAGFGRRLVASMIDGLLIGIVVGMPMLMLFGLASGTDYSGGNLGPMNVVPTVIGWAYATYFIGKKGQTVGKMAMKIKVVTEEGGAVSYGKAALREIVGKLLSSILLLGYLWMLWDGKKQTWHDKIAGTVVVKI